MTCRGQRMTKFIMFVWSLCVITGVAMAGGAPQPNDPYQDRGNFRETGPITPAERNAPWPSRSQPAEEYRDAFCKTWDDACTRCDRDRDSRVVDCRPMGKASTCERKRIVCTGRLLTQARVCLRFSDGCNSTSNGNGSSTAVLCWDMPPRLGDSTCELPRGSAQRKSEPRGSEPSRDDHIAGEDLAGNWWLVTPKGDTCVVTLNSIVGMSASEPCSPALKSRLSPYLGSFSTWPDKGCRYEVKGGRLDIRCMAPDDSDKLLIRLTFSVRNLESPVGIGRFEGWRLLRISTLW